MRSGVALFLVCLALVQGEAPAQDRLVTTKQGRVRGYKQPGDDVFVFYGVPYATAPTGQWKFKDPIPAPTWFSTFEAVNNTIACPQTKLNNNFTFAMSPQENCLVANIYVPDTTQKKLPVVVYVHGGAYQVGSGTFMEAKNLVRSQKVIVVTFNYRLGLHGFLCLGTHDIPGNAGMKDQIALLRWVNKHIESYGGNPKDVTIAGQSAGSSSVDLLMLSPAAKGLFHKVIPESGASLAPWSIQIDPLENAKYFAKKAGFENVDDIYALEEFYKTASLDTLTSIGEFFERTDANFLLSPCLERKGSEDAFLTDSPYNILKSGKYPKVPLLYGFADMEGLLYVSVFDTMREKMNANFSDFIPADLKFDSIEEREEVAKKIKTFYFGEKPVRQESILSFVNFITDVYFGYSTLKAVQLFVESGHDRVYLYEYNFVDDSEPAIPYTNNVRGATHCAQSFAIFDGKNFDSPDETKLSEDYKKVKAMMRELWVNFITTGVPVPPGSSLPAWPATGASGAPHMSLGLSMELRSGALLEQRVRFWDSIYERHHRAPQAPPAPPTRHTEL